MASSSSASQNPEYTESEIILGDPLPDALYPSCEALQAAYQQHAYNKGYAIVTVDSKGLERPNKQGRRVVYGCDRWGVFKSKKQEGIHESRKRANTSTRKCNCPFRIEAQELANKEWQGKLLVLHHNHTGTLETSSHPAHRRVAIANMDDQDKTLFESLLQRNAPVPIIRAQLRSKGVNITQRDVYNIASASRNAQLGGLTAIQWLVDSLKAMDWFVRVDVASNNRNRVTRIFFAHPGSVALLKANPDVILLDCTYKTNRFNMPLLNLCGATGNNLTPQFALAFLSGEKEDDYTWVLSQFKQLLAQESVPDPKVFVTDRELALMRTIDKQFNCSDHILCRWHINMNVVAKTKKHFRTKESFQKWYGAWIAVVDSADEEQYTKNIETLRASGPAVAFSYIDKTWLLWREKIVRRRRFW